MTTTFSSKQPFEEYAISFDFAASLGTAIISSVDAVTAVDQADSSDVSTTVLDSTKQSNTNTVVYAWVQAGTSAHNYLITCQITADDASQYELEAIQPVLETPISTGGRLITGPAIEPVTLAELKLHLRIDSGSFADNVTETQSIIPASKAIADNYTTHAGTGVDVLGYEAIVILNSGTNEATGTVDCKIQESDNNSTWTDWNDGAFTQVTTANDNAIQEMAYTGTKQYVRTVAKVLLAACVFGTTIITRTVTSVEDDLLTELIETARMEVENDTRRGLITQTWDHYLDLFPNCNYIKLPLGNLQSIVYMKYRDSDGDWTTMTLDTDYYLEQNGDQIGRVVLPYGETWPTFTAWPYKNIVIRFVCGYGDAASDVPAMAKAAIKRRCALLYFSRGAGDDIIDKTYDRLIDKIPRLYDEF